MTRASLSACLIAGAAALAGCQSASTTLTDPLTAYAPEPATQQPATQQPGTLVGGQIGAGLDPADQHTAIAAEYEALEHGATGVPVRWTGRANSRGEVVAGPPYQVNDRQCRQYTHTVTIGDKVESARAAACRVADGGWQVLG